AATWALSSLARRVWLADQNNAPTVMNTRVITTATHTDTRAIGAAHPRYARPRADATRPRTKPSGGSTIAVPKAIRSSRITSAGVSCALGERGPKTGCADDARPSADRCVFTSVGTGIADADVEGIGIADAGVGGTMGAADAGGE